MYLTAAVAFIVSFFATFVGATPIDVNHNPHLFPSSFHHLPRPTPTGTSVGPLSTAAPSGVVNPFIHNPNFNYTAAEAAYNATHPHQPKVYVPHCLGKIGLNLYADDVCRTRHGVFEGTVLGVHCVGDQIQVEGIDPYGVCKKRPTEDPNLEGGWTAGCECILQTTVRAFEASDFLAAHGTSAGNAATEE